MGDELYSHPAASPHPPTIKAPGVEPDWETARHWIDRYATGIDAEPQMSRIAAALRTGERG